VTPESSGRRDEATQDALDEIRRQVKHVIVGRCPERRLVGATCRWGVGRPVSRRSSVPVGRIGVVAIR
jgi:hypothetical protein